MSAIISILIILVCLLLILVVLVQNSKGGGLASSFASSNQVMGVRKTTDVLEKATWTFAIALVVLCLVSTTMSRPSSSLPGETQEESLARKKGIPAPTNTPAPNNAPLGPQGPTK
jgi:preprotein translocase subunit SecG